MSGLVIVGNNLDELICHNRNLVKTATGYRSWLHSAIQVMGEAIDCAEVETEQDGEPMEYIVPASEIEAMRGVIIAAKTLGFVD